MSGWLAIKPLRLVPRAPVHSASNKSRDACRAPYPELSTGAMKVSKTQHHLPSWSFLSRTGGRHCTKTDARIVLIPDAVRNAAEEKLWVMPEYGSRGTRFPKVSR